MQLFCFETSVQRQELKCWLGHVAMLHIHTHTHMTLVPMKEEKTKAWAIIAASLLQDESHPNN